MTKVWTSSSVAPSKKDRRGGFGADGVEGLDNLARSLASGCRRVPARARRPASREYRHRAGAGRNRAIRKALEDLRRSGFKSSAPELHGRPSGCDGGSVVPFDSCEHHQQQRFLRVQPIFGLVENHAARRFHHASVTSSPRLAGRQCMKMAFGSRVCEKFVVHLISVETRCGARRPRSPRPCWPRHRYRWRARRARLRRDRW